MRVSMLLEITVCYTYSKDSKNAWVEHENILALPLKIYRN